MRLALLLAAVVSAALLASAAGTSPPQVARLEALTSDLRDQTIAGLRFNATGDVLNDHVDGHLVLWKSDGNPFAESRALCNQIVTLALKTAWGTTDAAWKTKTGYNFPSSEHFYADIRGGKGFARVAAPADILPGDVVAIWYVDDPASGYPATTGHTAVVRSVGPVVTYRFPGKSTTVRFRDLEIFDSASTTHSQDTRTFTAGALGAGSAATEWKGAGRGWMRIYEDSAGNYAGHTWCLTGTKSNPPGTPPTWTYYSKNFKPESRPPDMDASRFVRFGAYFGATA